MAENAGEAGASPGALTTRIELGWKPCFEQQLDPTESAGALLARVGAHFGSRLLLLAERGEFEVPIQLNDGARDLAVGDWLVLLPAQPGADVGGRLDGKDWRIVRRLERQTELSRKSAGTSGRRQMIAANIDTLFIVSSCNQDFNLSRLERYLALALEAGALPLVVLTKADLYADADTLRRRVEKLRPGLLVEVMDARDPLQSRCLSEWCGIGKTVALLGSSGVGKSTLVNSLGVQREQATAGIREDDGKGRHTTTARSLHRIAQGGWLLDTPGMRELQLADCAAGVDELFTDVLEVAQQCRFRNCSHQGDKGCAVTAAVEADQLDARRVRNFLKIQAEQARNAQTIMERRESERNLGRMYKSIIAGKRNSRDRS